MFKKKWRHIYTSLVAFTDYIIFNFSFYCALHFLYSDIFELKEILDVLDPEPLFPESLVPFLEWMARYYIHPIGQVIQSALPGGLNIKSYKTALLTRNHYSIRHCRPAYPSSNDFKCLFQYPCTTRSQQRRNCRHLK